MRCWWEVEVEVLGVTRYRHRSLQRLTNMSQLTTAHHAMTHSTWKFFSITIYVVNTTDCAVNREWPRLMCVKETQTRKNSLGLINTADIRVGTAFPRVESAQPYVED